NGTLLVSLIGRFGDFPPTDKQGCKSSTCSNNGVPGFEGRYVDRSHVELVSADRGSQHWRFPDRHVVVHEIEPKACRGCRLLPGTKDAYLAKLPGGSVV